MLKDRKIKDPCELVLFHTTTKENLKGIMKEGIQTGNERWLVRFND